MEGGKSLEDFKTKNETYYCVKVKSIRINHKHKFYRQTDAYIYLISNPN